MVLYVGLLGFTALPLSVDALSLVLNNPTEVEDSLRIGRGGSVAPLGVAMRLRDSVAGAAKGVHTDSGDVADGNIAGLLQRRAQGMAIALLGPPPLPLAIFWLLFTVPLAFIKST